MSQNDSPKPDDIEASASCHCSLDDACMMILGGVGAISPRLYGMALDKIAAMTGRANDETFRSDVTGVLRTFPCPLD